MSPPWRFAAWDGRLAAAKHQCQQPCPRRPRSQCRVRRQTAPCLAVCRCRPRSPFLGDLCKPHNWSLLQCISHRSSHSSGCIRTADSSGRCRTCCSGQCTSHRCTHNAVRHASATFHCNHHGRCCLCFNLFSSLCHCSSNRRRLDSFGSRAQLQLAFHCCHALSAAPSGREALAAPLGSSLKKSNGGASKRCAASSAIASVALVPSCTVFSCPGTRAPR